jgi:prepilin-type N-terminal cleavage/methylation domain-containing protein
MKRQKGFSLLEMMIATVILVSAVGSAMVALLQAQHATQGITLLASTQQNLRAGMHFIVRDLTQAGAGIPQGGITIPYNASAVSNLNRPGTIPQTIFSSAYTVLPPIVPGNVAGQLATSVNPSTLAVLTGHNTDIINIMYADNTLVDVSGNSLNSYPIVQVLPSTPVCAGLITSIAVTLATNCFTMPGTAGTVPLAVGNLIMFTGSAGNALGYITGVNGQVISFAAGDPANLNGTGLANGTLAKLIAGGGLITMTRVWMISYYIDTVTNPSRPQLIRQVNWPGYPASGPANPPTVLADVIEDLQFSYDITNSTAAAGSYGTAGPGNAPAPIAPDTANQIRAVNIYLAARSETPYVATQQFFRNNLVTQVCVRSLAFVPPFTVN